MTKKIKILLAILLLIVINSTLIINCVQAANLQTKKVYEIDYCEKVLKYKGIPRGSVYVVYEENGKQYPAYCINPERIGVGETDSYDVNVNGYITDVTLWRIITNGYPYKTLEELGVANKKEAYLATKQAIYCYLDNRNVNEYSGIGEAGQRALNALKQIWNNAMNSTETKIQNTVNIKPVSTKWEQDKLNDKYIFKTYKIETPAPISNYTVEIKGENLPEGIMLVDKNNNSKNTFKQNEEFKILVPTKILKNNGSFEIKVKTQMETKPVLYGTSPSENLQNYALTVHKYEDASGGIKEEFEKNESEIKILKQEKESKKPLQGVEFQLLDKNKNPIYQTLITDENGEIILKNIEPGKYYLRETKTLEGYVKYDEDIKIDITLNEIVNVTVNNTKEKKVEVFEDKTEIEVGKESTQETVKETIENKAEEIIEKNINKTVEKKTEKTQIIKLPITGM